MNKKITLGFCVCIVLIVIVIAIILFFKQKSEYNLVDISDNFYNIFQTRKKSYPWDIEYQSIYSLFEPNFVNGVKTAIKERITDNIQRYIEWDLNNSRGGTLNIMLAMIFAQINDMWSPENTSKKIPTPIKEDERLTVCNSVVDDPRFGAECLTRELDNSWHSPLELLAATTEKGNHVFSFTKEKQIENLKPR